MKLFDEMPYLENETLVLHEMSLSDAKALKEFASDPAVY